MNEFLVLLGNNDPQSCCQQENFKERCHFLCDESDSSFWDELACAKERIKLFTCKAQESKTSFQYNYVMGGYIYVIQSLYLSLTLLVDIILYIHYIYIIIHNYKFKIKFSL